MASKHFHPWRCVVTLLLVALLLAGALPALAREPVRGTIPTETRLAVVRSGGAVLVDAAGAVLEQLPAGTALKADGRTADGRWIHVSIAGGTQGWVAVDRVLLFGLAYLPVLSDFQAPAGTSPPAAAAPAVPASTPKANPGTSAPAASAPQTATVTTTNARLNVRAGPGAGFAVIAGLAPGQARMATGRNAAGDWIRVELPAPAAGSGWVSASYVDLSGDPADLAVVEQANSPAPGQPASQAASTAPAATARQANGLTGKLVFQDSSGGTIYRHDFATGATRPLTHGADPALSPDGQQVVFWRDEEGQHRLLLVNADGTGERPILSRGEMIRSPSWSPDGQRIVFSRVSGQERCRDAGYGICLPDVPPYSFVLPLVLTDQWGLSSVDAQGGSFVDIPSLPSATAPQWGAQGIVYSGAAGIQRTAEGDDVTTEAILGEYRYQDPALQPGGNRIVFQSKEKDHWEIFAATDDGANVVALTRPATTLVSPLPQNVAPTWSPDGRTILFLSDRDGEWAFWVMNADGSDQRRLPIDVPVGYNYQVEQVASWGP